tara:strand:- start:16455 stop:16922 length:468 start_codon:yes stop_codon:yes gene_type:complete
MGKSQKFLRASLALVVVTHWALIFGNFASFVILPFYTSWYIALPLMSYIGLLTFSRVLDCPLTKFENKIRRSLGMSEVKGFIGHYLIKPYVRQRRRIRNRNKAGLALEIQIPTMKELAKFKKEKVQSKVSEIDDTIVVDEEGTVVDEKMKNHDIR